MGIRALIFWMSRVWRVKKKWLAIQLESGTDISNPWWATYGRWNVKLKSKWIEFFKKMWHDRNFSLLFWNQHQKIHKFQLSTPLCFFHRRHVLLLRHLTVQGSSLVQAIVKSWQFTIFFYNTNGKILRKMFHPYSVENQPFENNTYCKLWYVFEFCFQYFLPEWNAFDVRKLYREMNDIFL